MSLKTLCDIQEISQALGLPFAAALRLYQALELPAAMEPIAIYRRHDGTIGELEVIL